MQHDLFGLPGGGRGQPSSAPRSGWSVFFEAAWCTAPSPRVGGGGGYRRMPRPSRSSAAELRLHRKAQKLRNRNGPVAVAPERTFRCGAMMIPADRWPRAVAWRCAGSRPRRVRCVPNPDTLIDSLERFAAALTSGYGIGDVLHSLTEEMAQVLNLTGAGVTLVHDGQQRFVTAAVEAIASLERCRRAPNRARASTLSHRQARSPCRTSLRETPAIAGRTTRSQPSPGVRPWPASRCSPKGSNRCVNLYDSQPRTGQPRICESPGSSPASPPATSPTLRLRGSNSAPPRRRTVGRSAWGTEWAIGSSTGRPALDSHTRLLDAAIRNAPVGGILSLRVPVDIDWD